MKGSLLDKKRNIDGVDVYSEDFISWLGDESIFFMFISPAEFDQWYPEYRDDEVLYATVSHWNDELKCGDEVSYMEYSLTEMKKLVSKYKKQSNG